MHSGHFMNVVAVWKNVFIIVSDYELSTSPSIFTHKHTTRFVITTGESVAGKAKLQKSCYSSVKFPKHSINLKIIKTRFQFFSLSHSLSLSLSLILLNETFQSRFYGYANSYIHLICNNTYLCSEKLNETNNSQL